MTDTAAQTKIVITPDNWCSKPLWVVWTIGKFKFVIKPEVKCFCGVGGWVQPHCPVHGTPKTEVKK